MSLKIKALALVLVILPCLTPNANAVLGVGDIVFDPAALAEALRQTIQMIDTVDMLRRQYQHMLEMARGLPLPFMFTDWYAPIWTPWLSAWPLSDVYQLNNTWARALHGSQEFEEGYRTATEALDTYGPELESILDDVGSSRLKRRYTGVELQDGSNVHALHLIGKVSLHSKMTEPKVSNLEEVIFSSRPRTSYGDGGVRKAQHLKRHDLPCDLRYEQALSRLSGAGSCRIPLPARGGSPGD